MHGLSKSFVEQSRQVADKLLERFDRFELSRLEVLVAVKTHLSARGCSPTAEALARFFNAPPAKVRYHLSGLSREGLIVMAGHPRGRSSVVLLSGRGQVTLDVLTGRM